MTDSTFASMVSHNVRQGLRISAYSLVWTLITGSAAIAAGVVGSSVVLVVFGAIGLLDAVGSATLVAQFRHTMRHEALSDRRERITLHIVRIGMATVGAATIADCIVRLAGHVHSGSSLFGVALASVSIVVLAVLAHRKQRIARRIPSNALRADGWMSATGALLAGVTLVGATLAAAFDWWWSDPVAALGVAAGAIIMSIVVGRTAPRA